MNLSTFQFPAVMTVIATASLLVMSNRWQFSIPLLGFQYLAVALLIALEWPLPMALTIFVAGVMGTLILLLAIRTNYAPGLPDTTWYDFISEAGSERPRPLAGFLFHLFVLGLAGMAIYSVASQLGNWIPGIEQEPTIAGVILIGFGLLHLGMTENPVRIVIGLLSVLSGFQIIYAALEASLLVAGLLAVVHLGLAFSGAYLWLVSELEESQ